MSNSSLRLALVFGTLVAISGVLYACGDDDGGPAQVCTGGQSQVCQSPTGPGSQTCLPDGTGWGTCLPTAQCGAGLCCGGETCNATPISGQNACGQPGTQVPPTCATPNTPCGPSGGMCTTLPIVGNVCVKMCQGAGGTGGVGGVGGVGGIGGAGAGGIGGAGAGGIGGVGGVGGTGGVGGAGGVGGGSECMGGETCTSLQGFNFCSAGGFPASCPTMGASCGPSGGTCTMTPLGQLGCVRTCTPAGNGGTGGAGGAGGAGGSGAGCPSPLMCTAFGAMGSVCTNGIFPPACDGSMMCPMLPGGFCVMGFCIKQCM